MNQTPAALLILTSSILAFAATVGGTNTIAVDSGLTTQTSVLGVLLGLASFALGFWGVVSLIGASVRDREGSVEGQQRTDLLSMLDPRRAARPYALGAMPGSPVPPAARPTAAVENPTLPLSPEVKAQLAMASHLEGRDRNEIIEEALRRYLPGRENKAA